MAGRIRRDDIDALRERADIVAVVGDHTKLVRAGKRYKGLCPFHQERTPSFTVDPSQGLYHCFGCGAGGDLYDFLMRIEGLEFTEAVEQLARRTNYTLHYEELSAGERRALGERSRLVAVTAAAHAFFREALYGDAGAVARDYLKERGFGRDDAERFELGFAPNAWDELSRHLVRQGVDQRDAVTVGVASRNQHGGLYDRFRGRLIFPVHDLSGDVIGFGGRVLPGIDYGDATPPKYYNSPETPLYHKQRVLYGLQQARAEIVRAEAVLICEGYTDVMALHQAGFANAVATCGTAVGRDHLRILARYAQRIVLAFDPDAAGHRAAERAWREARVLEQELGAAGSAHTFDLKVLALPPGRDPADVVRDDGIEAIRAAVDGARGIVPFLIERRVDDGDLGSEEGKAAALHAALEVLRDEPSPELRRAYARTEVADRIGTSFEYVTRTAARLGIDLDQHEGIAQVAPTRAGARGGVARADRQQRVRHERAVLRIAIQRPELLPAEWAELTQDDLTHPKARTVLATIAAAGGPGAALQAMLDAAADDDVRTLLRELALEDTELPEDPEAAATAAGDLTRALLVDRVVAEQREVAAELDRVNPSTEPDTWRQLNERWQALELRRRGLAAVDA